MLSIILLILKILGITLLCILGFILLLIILVLFLPIKYKIIIDKPDDSFDNIKIKGQVTYFLRVIRATFLYPGENLFSLRVLFFRLFPKKEKKEKFRKTKNNRINETQTDKFNNDNHNESLREDEINKADINLEIETHHNESSIAEPISCNEQNNESEQIQKEKVNFKDKFNNIVNKCRSSYCSVREKINEIKSGAINITSTVDHYKTIVDSSTFKKSFALCKKQIIKIFKIIKPKTIKGNIYFGADSPDTTAEIFGMCSLIIPYLGKKLYIYPDLQNKTLTGHILVKGRVHIVSLLLIGIKIFFNKDLKKTLKMFKKE